MDDLFFGAPPASQRQAQKDLTRSRIVVAAIELINDGGEEAVTMRAVARRVGVSERTVHRHFETRDHLIDAVWRLLPDLVGRSEVPQTADALVEEPRRRFPKFSERRELVRAFVYSQARRKRRSRQNPKDQQARMDAIARDIQVFLDERSLRRRAAIIQVITSPYAWELMREWWGFSGEEAADAAAEAVEILLNRRPPF